MNAKLAKRSSMSKLLKPKVLTKTLHLIQNGEGKKQKSKVARSSTATANILEALPETAKTDAQKLSEKFVTAFQNPVDHLSYLQSQDFANNFVEVCGSVSKVFENEARCLGIQSPCYVIGDIHGNLEDLHFFADNMWRLGIELTAGKFLFLGDYVDRGISV
jgi:hypothetical protein